MSDLVAAARAFRARLAAVEANAEAARQLAEDAKAVADEVARRPR
jgi:hypothetical protein